jgi:hypothetical protein
MSVTTAHLTPARDHCLAPTRTIDAPVYGGTYDRLFPELEPLDVEEAFLHTIGGPGGACDASPFAEKDGDDARGAAGWPFFGQFVAHDITADRSALQHHTDATTLRNLRSPRINLECLYGEGPVGAPYLYDRENPAKLLLGVNDAGRPDDLPRNSQGVALIGDPRNDVHLVMSQLHVAMLKLHNGLVDSLREDGVAAKDLPNEARRAATWHYQWIVAHEFLPLLIGRELADELLTRGPRCYCPTGEPFIPLEFADAAYRYGHSQIRHYYRLNADTVAVPLFPDLMGFGPVPAAQTIDWSFFFDLPDRRPAQRARKIDGRLARALIELPFAITGEVEVEAYRSLAVRDLQRGQGVGLPSGEAVARRLAVEPLTADETGLRALGWAGETPLWYYVLKEAEARAEGDQLGPVGGRIVGELLVGILDRDPESQRAREPDWRPTLPAATPGDFTLADLFAFAAASA